MGKKLLILDVDVGVDDAQAMTLALAAPNIEILGITCTHGNTSIENVCRNVLRILKLLNRMEVCGEEIRDAGSVLNNKIPVYRGSATSLLGVAHYDAAYHGQDGMGDVPDPDAPGLEHIQSEHAVNAMIRIANEHPGQVSLVAIGPLTNVALAAKLDPTFPTKLKSLHIMGGNMEAKGNVNVCSEFNFNTDAEAASIVLSHFTCPTYIATWEYCLHHVLPWDFYEKLMNQDSEKAQFLKKIFEYTVKFSKSDEGSKQLYFGSGFLSCDSYAMAAVIDDSVVMESIQYGVTVELNGSLTRGMMVVDTLDALKLKHKAVILLKCDMEKYKQLLINALK